jgi:hypothetical protein
VVVVAAGRDEGRARPLIGQFETQNAAVEIQRPLQIRDLEVDVADFDPGVDGRKLQGVFGHLGGGHDSYPSGPIPWLAAGGFATHM